MTDASRSIVFEDVSKFYGEVLGVNRVELRIEPGITSLVGPNGSGKTTLMNLMTGLLRPSRGRISILGLSLDRPDRVFRHVGYCAQYDSFPRGVTGWELVYRTLRLHGHRHHGATTLARRAIERVGLGAAANRRVAGYSKGMRQRIKLAQAVCHEPSVLVLDEPLNGLDPLARAEAMALFREWGGAGRSLVISSHILHEVDVISDQVVLLSAGYVVAEGEVRGMRGEIQERPHQVLVRCDRPERLAARLFEEGAAVEAKLHADRRGLEAATRDVAGFYRLLNRIVLETGLEVERVAPADEDVDAVYRYLLEPQGATA